jgi:glycyl-tRNA synthetase beta chain
VPELLLEIGCEELPAPWLADLAGQLRSRLEDLLAREHLEPESVRCAWTPRRLVGVGAIAGRQPDREEQVWGPSLKVAKDAGGRWTGAAQGFARKNGVAPETLESAPRDAAAPDELYLRFTRRVEGRPAAEVLPSVLAAALRGLAFPKRMSWDAWLDDGKGAFPFGRPVRWLVALLDGRVVPFTIFGVEAGSRGAALVEAGPSTRGHRFLPRGAAGRPFAVRSFDDLRARLREAFVLVDPDERASRVREGLAAAGAPKDLDDHGLVEEWRDLVEFPTVVVGSIPREFRSLPTEVLSTVLVHHQKYIPLSSDRGSTPSRFAAVTNTDGSATADIVRGMERVVVARLRDASFFFAEDLKRPLADRVQDLAGVTFHRELGSYLQKAERMAALVDAMGARLGLLTKPEHQAAREAALLSKADLTTLMVREFPELQGVMGAIYLRAQGTPWESVVSAVRWHYHPLSVDEGSEPAGHLAGSDATVFGAVSLSDKLDTLAGYFGLGQNPTGSSDPYGLRRAGQGAVRVLLDFWSADSSEQRPSLRKLVDAAVAGYGRELKRPAEETRREVESFLLDRLRYVLSSRGFPADEVDAVLAAREPDALDDPHEALIRLRALHTVRSEARDDFEHLAVAFKRAKNILGSEGASVDPGLLSEEAERQLHAAVADLSRRDGGYEARLRSLAGLRAPVDRFFDDVLVMAEDPRIRSNRLGLLSEALSLFYRIADISKLGG